MFSTADKYVPQCTPRARSLRRPLLVWLSAATLALAVVGLIITAPLFLAGGQELLAQAVYRAFKGLCHQIPERAFHVAGHPLAVCARCTGLYAGVAAGVLLFPLLRSLRSTETPARQWLFIAAAPMLLDVALDMFGVWRNTHLTRFATGALLGAVVAFYIVPGLVDLSRTNLRPFFGRDAAQQELGPTPVAADAVRRAPSDYGWPTSRI